MGMSLDQWRVSIGLFHNSILSSKKTFTCFLNSMSILKFILKLCKLFFSSKCYHTNSFFVLNFCSFQRFLILLMVLLQAGDVETNPGPENLYDLSVLHLNTRSIKNKIDYITDNFLDFNILCFTETRLDAFSFKCLQFTL